MAKEPNKRSGVFGGSSSMKKDLRDISGDEKVTFADTWLGDTLGFDGKLGTQGPGLRRSWFGARRDGPGSEANIPNLEDRTPDNLEQARPTRPVSRPYSRYPSAASPEVKVEPLVPGTDKTLDTILSQPISGPSVDDSSPEVGDTAPTMESPSVASESVPVGEATDRPSLVPRPMPLPGVVDETAPTIEAATQYPIGQKLTSILGPKSKYVTQVLPRVLQTKLTGGSQNDINDLVRRVQSLPDSQTKQEVLTELYKMRDSKRSGGGGY